MKQLPWIPAPCKTGGKRFSKGNLCARHRRLSLRSFRNPGRDSEKLYVGAAAKSFGQFTLSNGDEILQSLDFDARDGELRLFNNLHHIKMLYLEARERIRTLKHDVTVCKDELFRTRVELDSEKEARRSAETRLETMSSAVRELERVVDAQKDYIREVRFAQRLRSQTMPSQTLLARNLRVVSSDSNGGDSAKLMVPEKKSGRMQTLSAMATATASDVGVQTIRIVQNQSVQTKALTNSHAQTAADFGDVDAKSLRKQLEVEHQLAQSLRKELMGYEKKFKGPVFSDENGVGLGTTGSGSEATSARAVAGGAISRDKLEDILATVRRLEEEVEALRKLMRQQKLVNVVMKQYFRILESSYASLFS